MLCSSVAWNRHDQNLIAKVGANFFFFLRRSLGQELAAKRFTLGWAPNHLVGVRGTKSRGMTSEWSQNTFPKVKDNPRFQQFEFLRPQWTMSSTAREALA